MASITLKNVTKSFGALQVVNDIALDVPDGEFLVLLGPSGCGKSTLLRMLAGLESVSSGEIHLNGRRVDQLPPSARDMAFVFQSYALYPHMTVRRNIAFPLLMRQFRWWHHIPVLGGIAKRRIERSPEVAGLIERTARILALTSMLDRHPRTLSGGQRQRVALGRAMVRKPEVFLMDEPLSNLDAKLRTSMRAEITRLHQDIGGTFVYVTHDQVEAMTMGSIIALMRNGVVQQFGTPRDIYADPANAYVARFIGTPPMNLLAAEVTGDGLRVGGVTLPVQPAVLAAAAQSRAALLLGIRPQAMTLSAVTAPGAVPGTISLVEHVGAESVIAVQLHGVDTAHDDEDGPAGTCMVTVPGYSDLRAGQSIFVGFDASEAVLFDRGSGERIRVQQGAA